MGFFPCASVDSVTLDGIVNDAHGDYIGKVINYEHGDTASDILKEGTSSEEGIFSRGRKDGTGAALPSLFPPAPCAYDIPVTVLAVLV